MNYHFDHTQLSDFASNIRKEWVITNGLGGYSGSSILGAHNRTHQGYLIACYHPPVQRYMVFSKTHEKIVQKANCYDLTTAQYADFCTDDSPTNTNTAVSGSASNEFICDADGPIGTHYVRGNRYLQSFDYDGNVHYTYQAGDVTLTKSISLVYGQNKVVIEYHAVNTGDAATLTVTPLMNFRDHSASSTPETLRFQYETNVPRSDALHVPEALHSESNFVLYPKDALDHYIWVSASSGTLRPREELYDVHMQLQTEVDNEVDGLDSNYTPFDLVFELPAKTECTYTLLCETGIDFDRDRVERASTDAGKYYQTQRLERIASLLASAGYGSDHFANALVCASDQFLAFRASTGLTTVLAGLPWFTDWGRDTMIAFTGLTLCTKQWDSASQILRTFAKYVHHGMVPNMFPDTGAAPLYNTVDASLWYFYAVDQYLKYMQADAPELFAQADDMVRTEIYPALVEIMKGYQHGTDFSIYMDHDGLLHAGGDKDQVTWMDVRVGDWVPTPRHGKPVEINALWYNALCVMDELTRRYEQAPAIAVEALGGCRQTSNDLHTNEPPHSYAELAGFVKQSFLSKFWYEEGNYLYDVIDGDDRDDSLRPNQLYAVSLPHSMLSPEQAASVVRIACEKLLAGPGIRSLSPDHKDYHPIYIGALAKRDAAYHQGTAWGFLMGTFISSYMKVHDHSPEAAKQAMAFLDPVRTHMMQENCIGSISEIFDGDAPHLGRGCYAQAWSVGEVLRCYMEDVKPYL